MMAPVVTSKRRLIEIFTYGNRSQFYSSFFIVLSRGLCILIRGENMKRSRLSQVTLRGQNQLLFNKCWKMCQVTLSCAVAIYHISGWGQRSKSTRSLVEDDPGEQREEKPKTARTCTNAVFLATLIDKDYQHFTKFINTHWIMTASFCITMRALILMTIFKLFWTLTHKNHCHKPSARQIQVPLTYSFVKI